MHDRKWWVETAPSNAFAAGMLQRLLPVIIVFLTAATVRADGPSPALAEALTTFRTEGPRGWAFTQTSSTPDLSRVETFDPLQPDHLKMTLIEENGAPPSPETLRVYREQQTRRSGGYNAPKVTEQLDLATAELTGTEDDRETWLFRLKPGDSDDKTARHMNATLTFHPASGTIERIVLANFEPFSPVFGVSVETARTDIRYSLPAGDTPSLLQRIEVSIRGRAFLFKSLDSDMTVVYSDHRYVGKS